MSDNTQAFCAHCDKHYWYHTGTLYLLYPPEYAYQQPVTVCVKCGHAFKRDKNNNLVWASDWRFNRVAVED